jgi:hypothetical protein
MTASARHLARRAAGWVAPQDNPSGAVYGIIAIGALLAAESSLRETYPETLGSIALTMVLYWLAHSYADALGTRLRGPKRIGWSDVLRVIAHDGAILVGAGLPFLAVLSAWAAGAPQNDAVTAGLWTAVGSLIAFELAAGVRSSARAPELVLDILLGSTMGLGLLGVRALLH